jgi:hypothetical protein
VTLRLGLFLGLLLTAGSALAQYPSPTMQNMTVLGTLTLNGPVAGTVGTALANSGSVSAETTRATAAEAVVAASVASETTRALTAEGLNATAAAAAMSKAKA